MAIWSERETSESLKILLLKMSTSTMIKLYAELLDESARRANQGHALYLTDIPRGLIQNELIRICEFLRDNQIVPKEDKNSASGD